MKVFTLTFLLLGGVAALSLAQQPAPASVAPYRLQKGDTIEVRVLNLPELTQTAVVRPDGAVSFQLAGDVPAAGMTTLDLGATLKAVYARQYRNPEVSVSVLTFANQTVYVGGEVAQPAALPLVGSLTLTGAIFRAGGFKDTALPESVQLVRDGADPKAPKTFNVQAILKQEAPDIALQPGDVVFVAKSTVNIYVGGEVAQPGLQIVQGKMTLLSAVIKAGGPLKSAATKDIILVRNSGEPGKPSISSVSLQAALKDPGADVALQPFDVVYIPKKTIAKVDQFVDEYLRQTLPFQSSGGFNYLLNATAITPAATTAK